MRRFMIILTIVAATVVPAAPMARAQEVPIQAFYGEFQGRTLFPMGEPRNRELSVRIERAGRFGFTVDWRTTIHKSENKAVRRDQVLEFEPTPRVNVYAAVSPSGGDRAAGNPGGSAAADLAGGAPFAWARINGRTLTVNVLTIEDNGDYVVQTYDRTLTDKGMVLEFMRVRNGHIEKQIKGNLTRSEG